jgi:peptidoglycan hydrolase-like protein with peptidoglycan-binding domain
MTEPLLSQGSSGPLVAQLQRDLNAALRPSPNLNPDGIFGPLTNSALRNFQTSRRINADCIVGPVTRCVLRGGWRPPPTVHNVRRIPQPTESTCWAAATAMIKNSSVPAVIAATPAHLVAQGGGTFNFSAGPDNVSGNQEFARAHGLRYHAPMSWYVPAFVSLIQRSAAMLSMLWRANEYASGSGSPGHRIVVFGIDSDGNPDGEGTLLHYHDPWPPNQGKTVRVSYFRMATDTPAFTYGVFTR